MAAGPRPESHELRTLHVQGGFPPQVDEALRKVPGLLEAVATTPQSEIAIRRAEVRC
jgi:hypothetical protein